MSYFAHRSIDVFIRTYFFFSDLEDGILLSAAVVIDSAHQTRQKRIFGSKNETRGSNIVKQCRCILKCSLNVPDFLKKVLFVELILKQKSNKVVVKMQNSHHSMLKSVNQY